MGNFNSDRKFNRRDSGRSEGRSSSRFGRDSDSSDRRGPRRFGSGGFNRPERRSSGGSGFEKQMHEVICDKCGSKCEVPFRPTAGKPVYCSDCFRKNESTDSRRPDNSGRELEQINQKLDKILSLLEEKN